jgi:hypothetical protein
MAKRAKLAKVTLRVKAETVNFMESMGFLEPKPGSLKLTTKARRDCLVARWEPMQERFPSFNDSFLDTWTMAFSQILLHKGAPESFKKAVNKIGDVGDVNSVEEIAAAATV